MVFFKKLFLVNTTLHEYIKKSFTQILRNKIMCNLFGEFNK